MTRDTEKRKTSNTNMVTSSRKISLRQSLLQPIQLDAHFIFNTLTMIQGHVLSGQGTEANRCIENFSDFLRTLMNFSEKDLVPLHDEIDMLKKYLAIEKDRMGGTLEYTILAEEIAEHTVYLPPMLTHPFVENAIRHGLMHKTGARHLDIIFRTQDKNLLIQIDDDGIGRKSSHDLGILRQSTSRTPSSDDSNDGKTQKQSKPIVQQIIDKYHSNGMPSGTTVLLTVPQEL